MEQTWRWWGPDDIITLSHVRQAGATGIVTALHAIPAGQVWPAEAVAERKAEIERSRRHVGSAGSTERSDGAVTGNHMDGSTAAR